MSVTAAARPVPALATFAVSAALIAANALAYGFTVLAARLLDPEGYGELAALLGVLLIAVVPATGLQTAGALALARGRSGVTPGQLHGAGLVLAVAVAALTVAATPLVGALLHLPDPAVALWLAALLVPHTTLGADQGILQGAQRFGRLAAITVAFTVARIAGAVAGLVAFGSVGGALAGMTAGAAVGALLAWLGCGSPWPGPGWRGRDGRAALGEILGSTLAAAAALLGFVLLTGLDVILARHWLAPAAAGEYAVGAIIAKVVFWLPQGVGVVVLPRLADPTDRRRAIPIAVAVVGGLGALLTVATAVAGERAVPLVGGSGYGAATGGAAWLFAAVGTLLAVAQLLLYSGIATADRISGVAVWVAVVAEVAVVAALAAGGRATVPAIAATATVVAALLVAAGLLRFRAESTGRHSAGVLRSDRLTR